MDTFKGCAIHEVEPGTEIEGPDGVRLTVTDTEAVFSGDKVYCTKRIADELRGQSVDNSNRH